MKVKIGDKVYDSHIEPVAVILDEKDKANIRLMGKGESMYARFPRGTDPAEAERWMNEKMESGEPKRLSDPRMSSSPIPLANEA